MLTHLSIPDQLKAIQSFSTLTKAPATFEAIYDLDQILKETDLSTISIEYLKTQPGVAAIIEERYLAPIPNLTELLTYPQDSLGYQFAHHLVMNHFDPAFYRQREVKDDMSYIALRRSQTHDIHHVVTGFSTDPAGELGLQAFQLAQMRSPIAIAILTAGLIHVMSEPQALNAHMQQIFQGWEMGLKTKPFMAQKWEEHWEKPLAQWQAELGLRFEPERGIEYTAQVYP
jgi:ubiquinone biosynthesis protein COQ4